MPRMRNGKFQPFSKGRRVVGDFNMRPCPGKCGASTLDGRWCEPCCFSPDVLLSRLREAMEALDRHQAAEDAALSEALHALTTQALVYAAMRARPRSQPVTEEPDQ